MINLMAINVCGDWQSISNRSSCMTHFIFFQTQSNDFCEWSPCFFSVSIGFSFWDIHCLFHHLITFKFILITWNNALQNERLSILVKRLLQIEDVVLGSQLKAHKENNFYLFTFSELNTKMHYNRLSDRGDNKVNLDSASWHSTLFGDS